MKILFIQKQTFMFFGVSALAGYLAERGHQVEVLIDARKPDLRAAIAASGPDLIGFSLLSNDYAWFLRRGAQVKTWFPDTPLIAGGAHAWVCPEMIELPWVDLVCVGEGEEPLHRLLAGGLAPETVPNMVWKQADGAVRRNPLGAPVADLDTIVEDRGVYLRRYPLFARETLLQVISSRGCPLQCTFCLNSAVQAQMTGLGPVYRRKTAAALVAEIVRLRALLPQADTVFFADDLFALDREYVRDFCERYRPAVGLPFMMDVFPFAIDEELAGILAAAGCRTLMVAPETGNEAHRRDLLGKPISDAAFIEMAHVAHRHGITVYATAMFIYPGQTVADAEKTVALLQAMRADYPFKSYFLPYPGTPAFSQAVAGGNIPASFTFTDLPRSYLVETPLRHPEKAALTTYYDWHYFFVRYPRFHRWFRTRLGLLGGLPGQRLISYLGIFLWFKRWKNLSWLAAARYLWRFRHDR